MQGYTFRLCYNGADDPEVVAPDSVVVGSVIHGGSACWAPNFSEKVTKGEPKELVVEPHARTDQAWNCHLVPETINGVTIQPFAGYWPSLNVTGPFQGQLGETWQIFKTKPVTATYESLDIPGLGRGVTRTYTHEWFGEVQDGLNACEVIDFGLKRSGAKTYKTMTQKEQQLLRHDFFEAALHHDEKKLKEIIATGIDVNVKDDEGNTALILLVSPHFSFNPCFAKNIIACIELLIDKGADTTVFVTITEPFKQERWVLDLVAQWAICLNTVGEFVNCECPTGIITEAMNLLLDHGAAGKDHTLAQKALRSAQTSARKGSDEALKALQAYLDKQA
jgi:hypothetical protein